MPLLRGELVNENSRDEPVCLKCNEGLVRVSSWAHGVVAGWRRGLSWSNS